MDGAFNDRLASGKEWEEEVYHFLTENPRVISVAFNGTEHTHPEFVDMLRRNNEKSAALLRYQPDGVFLTDSGDVYHFEAKHATAIEKMAWMVYRGLASIGAHVMVFVKHPITGDTYYSDVAKMLLIPGEITVARYPEGRRFPVHDGWIHRPGRTPYREIDFDSMKVFAIEQVTA